MLRELFEGQKALVMGLGLHGGGLESAKYLARHGAAVTVTDLRDETALAPSIDALDAAIREMDAQPVRYVLGRHETADFEAADILVKNPIVRPESPYLQAYSKAHGGKAPETDISLFLARNPARLLAVTGSKGKSTTAAALTHVLLLAHARGGPLGWGEAYLGGNITVSPLSFLDSLTQYDDVVLELSSWQLGDLRVWPSAPLTARSTPGSLRHLSSGDLPILKPRVAVLTAIMSDHQNWYGSMDAYVADKRLIYAGQDSWDATVIGDDAWAQIFRRETHGRALDYRPDLVPSGFFAHQKQNLAAAAAGLNDLGLGEAFITRSLSSFPGLEHRLELFHEAGEVRFYNDSAATIPEAAAAAINALRCGEGGRVILITGGTDKNLDFTPLAAACKDAQAVLLLAGSGTNKLLPLLAALGVASQGPFDSLETVLDAALRMAVPGDRIVFSPGCASFEMFKNEFDRGAKWKAAVLAY